MSVLLTAILNSQINTLYVLNSTEKRIKVSRFIAEELSYIERNSSKYTYGIQDGKFETEDHPLLGDRFQIVTEKVEVFTIPVKKISYEVFWFEGDIEKSIYLYIITSE